MCTHDVAWVERVGGQFGKFLKLNQSAPVLIDNVEGIEVWLTELADAAGRVVVRNYGLVWSPLTADAKRSLCFDVAGSNPSCPAGLFDGVRASLNSRFKDSLLNDCFADAIVYLGPLGGQIRASMKAAVERFGTAHVAGGPLVLVTESLGSKILTDAVVAGTSDERAGLSRVLSDTRVIFMAANQIPLLNLGFNGQAGFDKQSSTMRDLRDVLRDSRSASRKSAAELYLVAFSDPNDLLTYELPAVDRATINIRVSNTKTWFGALENPDTAHRGYLDNGKVWKLITCGFPDRCGEVRAAD
jgi:hypothetical protein